MLVDGSTASLEVARQEARRLNLLDRIEFVEGDFVRRAAAIDAADIVTLDRVICCYPDAEGLVGLSAAKVGTVYGLVLPRDRRLVRIVIRLENLWFRLRRKAYRAYVHRTARVDEIAAANGLHPRSERRTPFWRVVVYDRVDQSPAIKAGDGRDSTGWPRAVLAALATASSWLVASGMPTTRPGSQRQAQAALVRWADAVAAAGGQSSVVLVGELTAQVGDWEAGRRGQQQDRAHGRVRRGPR